MVFVLIITDYDSSIDHGMDIFLRYVIYSTRGMSKTDAIINFRAFNDSKSSFHSPIIICMFMSDTITVCTVTVFA